LVLVISLSLGFLIFGSGGKNEDSDVEVPNLLGVSIDEVKTNDMYKDFNIIETQEDYNSEYPAGQIYMQQPSKGMRVKKGSDIRVWVSLGEKKVLVPNLENLDYRQAFIDLDGLGLKYEITREYNDTVIIDYVIKSEPKAGTEVTVGSTVKLFVSMGKEIKKVKVPSLIDKTEYDALKALEQNNLVGNVTSVESDKPKGTVVSQSIESNTEVDEGTVVNIEVSDGSKALKTSRIIIELPQDRNTVAVEVFQEGKQVYSAIHSRDEKYIELELSGLGTQTIEVYFDRELQRVYNITFK